MAAMSVGTGPVLRGFDQQREWIAIAVLGHIQPGRLEERPNQLRLGDSDRLAR